jgi:hypothetical protein
LKKFDVARVTIINEGEAIPAEAHARMDAWRKARAKFVEHEQRRAYRAVIAAENDRRRCLDLAASGLFAF